jgi:DNA-directed RNA polymerase specialized sigma24 family protein
VLGPARADAENVAADILAKEIVPGVLHPRTDSFNQISTFDDLLHVTYSISKNRAIDFVRRSARRPEVLMDVVPDLPLDPAGYAPPDLMEQVLRHLQPPDPELFHDRFVLGHTTREIAANRSMSHGTVVSRFARALEKLRHLLKEDLEP